MKITIGKSLAYTKRLAKSYAEELMPFSSVIGKRGVDLYQPSRHFGASRMFGTTHPEVLMAALRPIQQV